VFARPSQLNRNDDLVEYLLYFKLGDPTHEAGVAQRGCPITFNRVIYYHGDKAITTIQASDQLNQADLYLARRNLSVRLST
jgi:hypothetical protein